MNQKNIIQKTEEYVKETLYGDTTGHDWWHIHRVRNIALSLAKVEGADLFIVELSSLLHDIADHKFHNGDEKIGPETARKWLQKFSIKEEMNDHICEIIAGVSYKGAKVETAMESMEGKVVQDADRLDAIGAKGIARAFAYGGYKNRGLYNPAEKPTLHITFEEYKNSDGSTLNHFYEKLFLLKDRMNTKAGRQIAEERHLFMKTFVDRFLKEWNEVV